MTTKNYLLANEKTYRSLSAFDSVAEMDSAIKQHKDRHKLSEGERDVLEVLQRHSCKYPGVCFMTNAKVGQIVGKRRETVSRIRKKLENKGFIRQYALKRDGGDRRETGSAAVFVPIEQPEDKEEQRRTPGHHTEMSRHEASNKAIYKTNTHKRDGDSEKSSEETGKRGLKTGIPKAIYNAIEPFFNAKDLYEVYGILLRAKASVKRSVRLEDYSEAYIDEFMNTMRKYKLGQVQSFRGLLYSAWERVTAEVCRKQTIGGSIDVFSEIMQVN